MRNIEEIKFRVWNNIKNLMSYTDNHIKEDYWPNDYIMQYTWFKDKNWEEIYEWDILKHEDNRLWWEVSFVDWCYLCFYYYEIFNDSKEFEIIWNIYENPNLLNNK